MFAFSHIYINISILFAEQSISDIVTEEMCSDLQESVKKVSKSDSEEPTQKEHNTGKVFINDNIVDNYEIK